MYNENKFYEALETVFTGANIEGDSGYVNLLKIKSEYYKIILKQFKKEVQQNQIINDSTSFKEEFFDKLYSFFEKYFSESGSVYFVKTANWQRVYEQVYTDNKDVVLFWKTHMLYYVKSDILFKSIFVEIADDETAKKYNFYFDVDNLQAKQNNEKKSLIFAFRGIRDEKDSVNVMSGKQGEKIFVFDVLYSERGNKTKTDDVVKATKIPESIIDKAFATFKKQSEVDFFINKNAQKFLQEQLDMYLHQILLANENKFDQRRLNQLKTIKEFAEKIIGFIAQFEDELVRVWNKPKFALQSNYVITLDKLSPELIKKLEKHTGIKDQIAEWIELGMVEKDFDFKNEVDTKYKYLPIDTKYFKDVELDILALFDNVDDALDGRLIHSENYQALNTLQEKYKEKVQCIYIDPPFNLGQNADFDYKVNYKDANWATILENRIRLAHKLLSDTGSIFVRCDYNGNFIVRCLLDDIFGKENFRNEIIINKSGIPQSFMYDKFNPSVESLFVYGKSLISKIIPQTKKRPIERIRWIDMHIHKENKDSNSVIFNGQVFVAPKTRHLPSQKLVDQLNLEQRVRIIKKDYTDVYGNKQEYMLQYLMKDYDIVDNNWTDIAGYSSTTGFSTENAEILLQRVIQTATQEGDLVLDFFMGSSTTQAVAQKLGRKWLGVEMGDQFNNVDLLRLKNVIFGKQSGISKDLKEKYKGSGFFKYEKLEQYEDTLRNMQYKETQTNILDSRKPFESYIFYADQKFAHILDIKKENKDAESVLDLDFDKLYKNIDFAETISNIKGLPIKRITKNTVILQNGENEEEIKIDYKNMTEEEKMKFLKILKPLIWWGA